MNVNAFSKKITTRLLVSYSIPLICLAVLGFLGYSSAQKTFKIEAQRDSLNASSYAVDNATYHLIEAVVQVQGSMLSPDKETQARYLPLYQRSHDAFSENMGKLKELTERQEDLSLQTMVEELAQEGSRIDWLVQKGFAELRAEDSAAVTTLTSALRENSVGLNREQLLSYLSERLDANTIAFERSQKRLTRTLMWGTALAALTTIGLGLLLIRQIRQQMNRLIGVVEHNGIQVTTSSTQISASSRQLEATVTEQVASTTQITATATEIAATADELTHTMERVSGLAEAAADVAGAGKQDLEHMADTIHQLITATTMISSKLGLIDDKANNISAVVTAITKVADQTNLLSLNAAIEAEKAGEYGAGFAVVAREIRRLADQTAIATLEIETMVQEMLSSVSSGVMEMDKFSQDVGENAKSITQISEQMAQIIYQVQSLVPQFETVGDGMLAQAQGAQQIKAAMEQLNETSQQTAESVKDTNQVILQLGSVAQDLQTEVAHFRLAV